MAKPGYIAVVTNIAVVEDGNVLDPFFSMQTRIHVPQDGGLAFIHKLYQDEAARADKGKQGNLDVYVTVDGLPVPGVEVIKGVTQGEWERMRKSVGRQWDQIADELLRRKDKEAKGPKKKK